MQKLAAAAAAFALVVACRGGEAESPKGADGRTARAGVCSPSSVVSTTSCPKRVVPPSNRSSARGCKSDADCKDGIEGRCVDSGYHEPGAERAAPRTNVFAEPPPLPAPTVCAYDQCNANIDCGKTARCQCGEGSARNACVVLDQCLADGDCGADMLCVCGGDSGSGSGLANSCQLGNCRTDADCNGHACASGPSGKFCTTDGDRCHTTEDCRRTDAAELCDFDRSAHVWACRAIPMRPPG